ncbi:DUF3291 domain-containing protein [Pseudooceanicola sp. LIPI14-2-Ac024]|uniref:DUF3291 domain-containing protein n=1 Tax=Pseudooceanicola sp. LIPI14-2-Ac024 TaxID=3344875 RepID=UPI0035D12779
MPVAHYNIARLRHPPGDPRVAGFVDNVTRVNAVAERSDGFVWRLVDNAAAPEGAGAYEALLGDPRLAVSLSVWLSPEALRFFVQQTVHGGFLRRRAEWFEPWDGPNYVIWPVPAGYIPTVEEGQARLADLARRGASSEAYDFGWVAAQA